MWVFCAGMKRSGSTLQYQLVADIVERQNIGRRIGYLEPREFTSLCSQHIDTPELLVVKTHAFLPEAEKLCRSEQALVFCVYRDLRDVAVSLSNKNGTTIEEILEKGELHACVSDLRSWTALPGVELMKYEQMIANIPFAVAQVAEHLDVNLSEGQCIEIAKEYSREKQRYRIQELCQSLKARGQESGYDSNSLLHENHIHSGAAGQWQQILTTDQVRQIENNFGCWLEEHNYTTNSFSTKRSNPRSIFGRLGRFGWNAFRAFWNRNA